MMRRSDVMMTKCLYKGELPFTQPFVGLIKDNDELKYRNTMEKFTTRCDNDGLQLNVTKTKEMVVDFRRKPPALNPITIKGENIETCDEYKYLQKSNWEKNINLIMNTAMKKIIVSEYYENFTFRPKF
eukprot:GHVO01070258.1.p1 GENE.GHVO01070258.1~~GHVO01070258.1.p1  ORF type:complete len:128 (+),score=10.12 GHVO01070258.1:1454-1837(+)